MSGALSASKTADTAISAQRFISNPTTRMLIPSTVFGF
jgi:hypothetical protein